MRKMINNIIYTIGHKLAVINYALEFTVYYRNTSKQYDELVIILKYLLRYLSCRYC